MLDAIFWLGNKIHADIVIFKTLLAKLFSMAFAQIFIVVGLVKVLIMSVSGVVNKAYNAMAGFVNSPVVDGNGLPSQSTFMDYLAVANTIFPLTELFAYMVLITAFWLGAVIYRFIKSWIPTVS